MTTTTTTTNPDTYLHVSKRAKPRMGIFKALCGVASMDNERMVITLIHISKDKLAVATNGASLIRVPYNGDLEPGNYGSKGRLFGHCVEGLTYPNYAAVIPDFKTNHRVEIDTNVETNIMELCTTNKSNGVKPWRRKGPLTRSVRDPVLTPMRFYEGGEVYCFDPFLLFDLMKALRGCGYKSLALELKDPLFPVRVATQDPIALGVIMPIRTSTASH